MFLNRVRLPIHAYTPQFPTEASRFRLANGTTKTQSVVIRKTYELRTDHMSELYHQRLVIALNHDTVTIEGDKYIGGIAMDGEYAIEWPDFMDYPLGIGAALIQVTPFDVTNSNCQTCDVLTQLSLVDDNAGEIAEGATVQVGVYGNDEICCFPITAEIMSFASGYLAAATIDEATGIVSLTAKNPVPSVGSIVMATYRVMCPDGTYDEADVYGSIAGSEPACEQPSGMEVILDSPDATVSWTNPVATPAGFFEWILYEADNPGIPIQSGTTTGTDHFVELTGLSYTTEYIFSVRSNCGDGVFSPYTNVQFTTPASGLSDCGTFAVSADDGTLGSTVHFYSYMDCDGTIQNTGITNLSTQLVCMLMDEFNQAVYFQDHSGYITNTYDSLC